MARPVPVTAVEGALERRRWLTIPLVLLAGVAMVIGLVVILWGAALAAVYFGGERTPYFASDSEHFKYGSIGAERDSGIPHLAWQALPRLFPETFGTAEQQAAARLRGQGAYNAFGFLYEPASTGKPEPRDLPIGISRRTVRGVEMVWFNCAVCHTGTAREADGTKPLVVAGMPSNNLDFHRFISFVTSIADDPRLEADRLIDAIETGGERLGVTDRLLWRHVIGPRLREGLLARRAQLGPLIGMQPAWGPGRVDTFNPYKVVQLAQRAGDPPPEQWIGASDFPSVFHQRPRDGMQLHWDGNNASLEERNLSAAVGAGLVLEHASTADRDAIRRSSNWLLDLAPPPSPMRAGIDGSAVERGRALYMTQCAGCHGYQGTSGYVFDGAELGRVVPLGRIGTDRSRLDSYTDAFRRMQREVLGFSHFIKTDGYANQPLDALWLRGPYLHNGSVPTLAALLRPVHERPRYFLRGSDIIDRERGGFRSETFDTAEACEAAARRTRGHFCFDTRQAGNGNGGHEFGTSLDEARRDELLTYLRTF